jgi:hypothetical protein
MREQRSMPKSLPVVSFLMSKDYENTTESSEAMIKIANIQWMLRRVVSVLYLL